MQDIELKIENSTDHKKFKKFTNTGLIRSLKPEKLNENQLIFKKWKLGDTIKK